MLFCRTDCEHEEEIDANILIQALIKLEVINEVHQCDVSTSGLDFQWQALAENGIKF
jgi:hypothetical protein